MTEKIGNPFESPLEPGRAEGKSDQEGSQSRPDHPKTRTRLWLLIVLGLGTFCWIGLILNPIRPGTRQAAIRSNCQNHLKQIALGLNRFEQDHGHLPPQYSVDESGNPLHSWRVLILPYLDEQELYDSIDLSKPWDHPVNQHARKTAPQPFRCRGLRLKSELTTYLANAWERGTFSGSTPKQTADIINPHRTAVLVFEVTGEQAVEWMSPTDGDYESFIQTLSFDGKLPHGDLVNVSLGDCSVHSIVRLPEHLDPPRRTVARERIHNLFAIDSGERFDWRFDYWSPEPTE